MKLAIVNQKGGTGKTTTSINLAAIWASDIYKKKVLLVDMDAQANTTHGLGVNEVDVEYTLIDFIDNKCKAKDCIIKTCYGNLYLMPADIGLAALELEETNINIVVECLNEISQGFDLVVFDCPPSLGKTTLAVLFASERVLIPIRPGVFSMKGLQHLLCAIENIRFRRNNPILRVCGVFYNEAQKNTNLYKKIDGILRQTYGNFILDTYIPSNVKIGEAQAAAEPIHVYDCHSTGYIAYKSLAEEVLKKWDRIARTK